MRVDLLTREYPPYVYGGAGVHVVEMANVLRKIIDDVRVHAFDGPREKGQPGGDEGVQGYSNLPELTGANAALQTLGVNLEMIPDTQGASVVHSHTWYANFAGFLAQLIDGTPHVITAHSLEPMRPWKAEQLGGGYRLSSFIERSAYESADAIIAVSNGMKSDILRCYPHVDSSRVHVIHNGIDLAVCHGPVTDADKTHQRQLLNHYGIDENKPTVIFVGRITRQKGLPYFLRSIQYLPDDTQIVLCAGAPDTPEIAREVDQLVADLQANRGNVVLISEMLPREDLYEVIDAADIFVTPSIYEPLGIVNLEAMALKLPVVGTETGGIPDVIIDGVTGYLVPMDAKDDGSGEPVDPQKFEQTMAERIAYLLENPELAKKMGQEGYARARDHFSWERIGQETVNLYQSLIA